MLELKNQTAIQKRKDIMPSRYQKLYNRVTSSKASPREAIKAHCLECMGWHKNEVILCNSVACPLYRYRPYQKSSKLAERATSPP